MSSEGSSFHNSGVIFAGWSLVWLNVIILLCACFPGKEKILTLVENPGSSQQTHPAIFHQVHPATIKSKLNYKYNVPDNAINQIPVFTFSSWRCKVASAGVLS